MKPNEEVSIQELYREMAFHLNLVSQNLNSLALTHKGETIAVVVPVGEWEYLKKLQAESLLQKVANMPSQRPNTDNKANSIENGEKTQP
jgi:antitoxin (DNA-binding transcriptional repressor) of toxin-antitoxin stability system